MRHWALQATAACWAAVAIGSARAETKVWHMEAERESPRAMRNGTQVVADASASGGKAVRIPVAPPHRSMMVAHAPKLAISGRARLVIYCRAEGLHDMGFGLPVTARVWNSKAQHYVDMRTTIGGLRLKPGRYVPISLPLSLPYDRVRDRIEIIFSWWARTEAAKAKKIAVYIDRYELFHDRRTAPVITEVWPDRAHYKPGQTVDVRVTVYNPAERDVTVTMTGTERLGLDRVRRVFSAPVTLKARESRQVHQRYQTADEEYGREIEVALVADGRTLDTGREYVGVSRLPLTVCTGTGYDQATHERPMHHIFYVGPCTFQESLRSVLFFKRKYHIYKEFFSWAPGDISDLAPTEDPFPGGEGRMCFRSAQTVRQQTGLLRQYGLWPVTYVNGTCWAESGYRLFQRHPEWFLYDSNGEVVHYSMKRRDLYRRKDFFDFSPDEYSRIFFQATLNHSLPAVQRYVADQYIASAREFGFKGVRMDVRYLEVHKGERDFYGREVAKTAPEADRISAASVRNTIRMVREKVPGFTFGWNFSAPEENLDYPLTLVERCKGGAWMLDEVPCTYQSKTSPYHVWSAYATRMASWSDRIRQLGGVYNPFDFRRGGGKHVVDRVYSTLIRLLVGGHFNCYRDSSLPLGDLGQFATRFSVYLFNMRLRRIDKVTTEADVKAPAPLWWKDFVNNGTDEQGRAFRVVHLLNPPSSKEVEENPTSKMRPPVRNTVVTCGPHKGKPPRDAWLLSAEPLEPGGTCATRAVKLKLTPGPNASASVRVGSVIFWKMVVFRY